MNPCLLDLNLSSCFWQDQGSNLLLNPDFEGAAGPPPASWTQLNGYGTREAGARTGGPGLYVGRLAYNATAAGYLYQVPLTDLRRYHHTGWIRSDGVAIPLWANVGAVTYWTGLASNVWQLFDTTAIATGAYVGLQCANLAAGRYVEGDDLDVREQFLYTRAQGTLAQTPTTSRIQCGDGRTAATFPGQLGVAQSVLRGWSLNGSQYAQYLNTLASGTYTACFLVNRTITQEMYLLDARTGGGTGSIALDGAGAIVASSGTAYVEEVATTATTRGPVLFVAVSGITISAPTKIVLAASNALNTQWIGNWYGKNLRVGALTPRQLRDQRQRMLARVHGP